MSIDELEKKGVEATYGTPTQTNVSRKGLGGDLLTSPVAGV